MTLKHSPLQEVTPHPWGNFRLYLKREDLLKPAGGNKVRRFDAFFAQYGHLDHVMTLSNPGSHSFHVLSHYLDEKPGCDLLTLLERNMPFSPYHRKYREQYLHNENIRVIFGSTLRLLSVQRFFQRQGVTKIGIGGHVNLATNPYIPVMRQCVNQLRDQGIFDNVYHYFPIASGNMADGFLEYLTVNNLRSHKLRGLMTGAMVSKPLLRLKYTFHKQILLYDTIAAPYDRYKELSVQFYDVTGVWLDPVHTIQFVNMLHEPEPLKHQNIVLWITHPYLKDRVD